MSCSACREAHDGTLSKPCPTHSPAGTFADVAKTDTKPVDPCQHERVRRCADGSWRCFECSFAFLPSVVALNREIDAHQRGGQDMRHDYERACQTIAEMHAAAVGEVTGPKRGVVEDVADVRKERDELKRKVEDAFNRGHRAARLAIDRALKNPGRESLANLEYCIERLKEDSDLSKQLCALLSPLAGGSTDDGEGAVDVLKRLIAERQSERDAAHRRDRLLENCVQALGITDVTHEELPAMIADWAKHQRERIAALNRELESERGRISDRAFEAEKRAREMWTALWNSRAAILRLIGRVDEKDARDHETLRCIESAMGQQQAVAAPLLLESDTILALTQEVARARQKHPGNLHLFVALTEEVGELAKALLEGRPRKERNAEAIQVATVALRIVEEGDADFDPSF